MFQKRPLFATIAFPVITLKLYNDPIKLATIFIQYNLMNYIIFPDVQNYPTKEDLHIFPSIINSQEFLFIFNIFFAFNKLVNDKIIAKQKKHVMVSIITTNAVIMAFAYYIQPFIKFSILEDIDGFENLLFGIIGQIGYTILFIFINGPLRVLQDNVQGSQFSYSLEIKEGKTSVKKMIEDYEEERETIHGKLGVIKKDGILPTRNLFVYFQANQYILKVQHIVLY